MEIVVQLIINAIIAGSVYALVAAGLTFIYATSRIFHLAHGVVIVLGAYAFHWAWKGQGWPVMLAIIASLVISVAVGVLMNELVYEPQRRRHAKKIAYLVSTAAMLMIGISLTVLVFGSGLQSFGVFSKVYHPLELTITRLQLVLVAVSVVLLLALAWFVKRTRFGKAMRATADNEDVAAIMGIRTRKIRRAAFLIGSLLAAIAGILIGLEFNLEPGMGVLLAIKGLAAMVIGGVGSVSGAIFGAFLVGFVEQLAVWYLGAGWKNSMAFVLLFMFLLVRPRGIFGMKNYQ